MTKMFKNACFDLYFIIFLFIYKVRTEIIPIIVGALGTIPKRLPRYLKSLGVPDVIGCMQTSALLSTQRILKNTLSL